jgi:hypothetical protein
MVETQRVELVEISVQHELLAHEVIFKELCMIFAIFRARMAQNKYCLFNDFDAQDPKQLPTMACCGDGTGGVNPYFTPTLG